MNGDACCDGDDGSSEDEDAITYYDDNPALPAYFLGKTRGIEVVKVAKILLCPKTAESGKVATQKPVAVSSRVITLAP